jgi:RNA polymerase sigma-54 factor
MMIEAASRASMQQGVALAAHLQDSLRLLQMSGPELAEEIARLLDSNPMLEGRPLEPGEEPAGQPEPAAGEPAQAAAPDEPVADEGGVWGQGARPAVDDDLLPQVAAPVSLTEHLCQQIAASALAGQDAAVARLIVGALDDDGYLRDGPEELFSALLRQGNATGGDGAALRGEFDASHAVALRFVQSLDPAGVGARSVAECLALQIGRMPAGLPGCALAARIAADCLDLFARNDIAGLQRRLACDAGELARARALILRLSPRPGQAFSQRAAPFIVPDVLVRRRGGKWQVVANPDAGPRVGLNRAYAAIVRATRGWSRTGMGNQRNEARWLLRSLRQRAATIQRVAEAILAAQQRWLEHGDIALQPLFLRDIAAVTGLHESTVSRVTQGKYMATPRGIVEFRHFFGSRLVSGDGFRMSPQAVQILIRDILAAEDPAAPLSDIRLTRQLEQRGVKLARRTVSKYRDAIGIPPVAARRLDAMGPARS